MWTARTKISTAALLLALLGPTLLCPPTAQARQMSLERQFRSILATWSEGSVEAAQELADFQQALVDAHAGHRVDDTYMARYPERGDGRFSFPGHDCLNRVERFTLEPLFELDSEVALPLFVLYLRAYAITVGQPGKLWLARRLQRQLPRMESALRIRNPLGRENKAATKADLSLLLLAQADEMWSQGKVITDIGASTTLFERAWRLAPESLAAAYWSAVSNEYVSAHGKALRHLRTLAKRWPEDPEIALRLALAHERDGKPRLARESLSRLSEESVAPRWIRILAHQELARLRGQGQVAQLEKALEQFPNSSQLALQLTAYLKDDWPAIDALAANIAPEGGTSHSPRLRYDRPRRQELDSERLSLEKRTRDLLPALGNALVLLSTRNAPMTPAAACSVFSLPRP